MPRSRCGREFQVRTAQTVNGIDHLPKTREAVVKALDKLAPRLGLAALTAEVAIANPIPAGKGMGSSSSDVTAAVGAVGAAAGHPFPPESIAEIALSVEPSDGVMFPGIAMFDHRCGSIAESLGAPPPMEVIVIDTGGNGRHVGIQPDRPHAHVAEDIRSHR